MNDTPFVQPDLQLGIAAAKDGDVKRLGAWLANGGNPNVRDAIGWTSLLWASVRGHADCVRLLLHNDPPADQDLGHGKTGALAVHMAGQSGDLATAQALLDDRPDLLDAVFDINGHTILLQAVFYGHYELAKYLLERGARTDITTARGLGPLELMQQFQNQRMVDLIHPYDAPREAKDAYYANFLSRIAQPVPDDEKDAQVLADELYQTIAQGLAAAPANPASVDATLAKVDALVDGRQAGLARLAGPQQQPPLIVVVTGNNGFPPNPDLRRLRFLLAKYLLERGADPLQLENHPMKVQTIIRAAVFNHLEILEECAKHLTHQQLADGINEVPWVNGLTAMHDTVLRSTMAAPEQFEGYLKQAEFFLAHGGRVDMEDFSGVTQRNIAERCDKPAVRSRLLDLMDRYTLKQPTNFNSKG